MSQTMYRVAEINTAYDRIPGCHLQPECQVPWLFSYPYEVDGPGWIYISNEVETIEEAQSIQRLHEQKVGLPTKIDKITTI